LSLITEYRVVWKRAEQAPKNRRFVQRSAVLRLLTLLGPEPWKAYTDKDPDELACCSSRECGCAGWTIRQVSDQLRTEMPALEWVSVESRAVEVSSWQEVAF
jgi:hypothetical protein